MRLWTIQGIEIYEQLQRDGMAYCTKPTWSDDEKFMKAYHWMADQMRQRIGEPPIKISSIQCGLGISITLQNQKSHHGVILISKKGYRHIWKLRYLTTKCFSLVLRIGIMC